MSLQNSTWYIKQLYSGGHGSAYNSSGPPWLPSWPHCHDNQQNLPPSQMILQNNFSCLSCSPQSSLLMTSNKKTVEQLSSWVVDHFVRYKLTAGESSWMVVFGVIHHGIMGVSGGWMDQVCWHTQCITSDLSPSPPIASYCPSIYHTRLYQTSASHQVSRRLAMFTCFTHGNIHMQKCAFWLFHALCLHQKNHRLLVAPWFSDSLFLCIQTMEVVLLPCSDQMYYVLWSKQKIVLMDL